MDPEQERLIDQVRCFLRKKRLEKAIIFGSFATGRMHQWSDIDIMLVSEKFAGMNIIERARMIGLALDEEIENRYPIDMLFFTPDEFEEEKNHITIVREAVREGIIVLP